MPRSFLFVREFRHLFFPPGSLVPWDTVHTREKQQRSYQPMPNAGLPHLPVPASPLLRVRVEGSNPRKDLLSLTKQGPFSEVPGSWVVGFQLQICRQLAREGAGVDGGGQTMPTTVSLEYEMVTAVGFEALFEALNVKVSCLIPEQPIPFQHLALC